MATKPANRQPLLDALSAIEVDDGVLAFVNSFGDAGRQTLLDLATDPGAGVTPDQRARAVWLLGELRWRPALKPLVRLLHDESEAVRLNAIYALSSVGGPHATKPLLQVLSDPKKGVTAKAHALRCLMEVGDEAALQAITTWTETTPSLELKALGREAIAQLRLSLKDKA